MLLMRTQATCKIMAAVAGSLANGGVCPMTGEQVFTSDVVRRTLAVMQSCGEHCRMRTSVRCFRPVPLLSTALSRAMLRRIILRPELVLFVGRRDVRCQRAVPLCVLQPLPESFDLSQCTSAWHCLMVCRAYAVSSRLRNSSFNTARLMRSAARRSDWAASQERRVRYRDQRRAQCYGFSSLQPTPRQVRQQRQVGTLTVST